jgi:nucleoside-diphosphate-sugar epimerase
MTIDYSAGPSDGPVLVTGATGYVAGWVVKLLLDRGVEVHACVRDPDNAAKVMHLRKMAEGAPGKLRLFKADLLDAGSHEAAMQGCRIVMHTASPFLALNKVSDFQRDFVDPALKGTRDILETASRVRSVKRVVLTSSTVAVVDIAATPDEVRTEASWNESATLEAQPYPYSKVLAEREAWKIANAQNSWKLVVINPAFVLGPGTTPNQTSASFDHIKALSDGTYSQGAPPVRTGCVDVRDVAEAHMRGAFIEAAEGRNIVFGEALSFSDMGRILREEFGEEGWKFPPDPPAGQAIRPWQVDNAKSKAALGMNYRPLRPAIIEMFRQMVESGA